MLGIGIGLHFPVSPTSGRPLEAVALPGAPTARWHPQFSQTTTRDDRIVSASDLQGLADISEGSAGIGPKVMADGLGRKFWRFSAN